MGGKITVKTDVKSNMEKVWNCWTKPEHIVNWNFASDAWCCPKAINDIKAGGKFSWRMEAKDGSFGFDFTGSYQKVIEGKLISYLMEDGRSVEIHFNEKDAVVNISESFEAEGSNSDEMQRTGWQAILENFKHYVENN